jgi:hypothetical protein
MGNHAEVREWSVMVKCHAKKNHLLSPQQPTPTYITKALFPQLVYLTSVPTIVHLVRD